MCSAHIWIRFICVGIDIKLKFMVNEKYCKMISNMSKANVISHIFEHTMFDRLQTRYASIRPIAYTRMYCVDALVFYKSILCIWRKSFKSCAFIHIDLMFHILCCWICQISFEIRCALYNIYLLYIFAVDVCSLFCVYQNQTPNERTIFLYRIAVIFLGFHMWCHNALASYADH